MQVHTAEIVGNQIEELHHCHSQCRVQVVHLLDDAKSLIKSVADEILGKIRQFDTKEAQSFELSLREDSQDDSDCRDVHINTEVNHDLLSKVG